MGGLFKIALLASGAAAIVLSAPDIAGAQEAPADQAAVNLADPQAATQPPALDLTLREGGAARFTQNQIDLPEAEGPRRLQLELAASGEDGVDLEFAQRASIGTNEDGDVNRRSSGSEVRIGRGLVGEREQRRDGAIYAFVASDNEALTWQPGARSEFGGRGDALALQEQVTIGDVSAGVTYERNGVQASLAYVQREQTTRVGRENFSQDQEFAGVTVTMRR